MASTPTGTELSLQGPDSDALDTGSLGEVEEVLRRWIPDLRLADIWSQDWHSDQFSRETWRVARPGQLTRDGAELRRPEGPIILAGADVALGPWNGLVDGAIESGLHAAREAAFAVTRPDGDHWT